MKINTNRFGEIEIEEGKIIHFRHGLLGFGDIKRYTVLDHANKPEIPFKWLQAIDDPDLAFVITDPILLYPNYNPPIEEDVTELNLTDPSDRGIVVIVTMPNEEPERMTANLLGPIVINLRTREAKQIVLVGEEYPLRYPLFKNIPVSKP